MHQMKQLSRLIALCAAVVVIADTTNETEAGSRPFPSSVMNTTASNVVLETFHTIERVFLRTKKGKKQKTPNMKKKHKVKLHKGGTEGKKKITKLKKTEKKKKYGTEQILSHMQPPSPSVLDMSNSPTKEKIEGSGSMLYDNDATSQVPSMTTALLKSTPSISHESNNPSSIDSHPPTKMKDTGSATPKVPLLLNEQKNLLLGSTQMPSIAVFDSANKENDDTPAPTHVPVASDWNEDEEKIPGLIILPVSNTANEMNNSTTSHSEEEEEEEEEDDDHLSGPTQQIPSIVVSDSDNKEHNITHVPTHVPVASTWNEDEEQVSPGPTLLLVSNTTNEMNNSTNQNVSLSLNEEEEEDHLSGPTQMPSSAAFEDHNITHVPTHVPVASTWNEDEDDEDEDEVSGPTLIPSVQETVDNSEVPTLSSSMMNHTSDHISSRPTGIPTSISDYDTLLSSSLNPSGDPSQFLLQKPSIDELSHVPSKSKTSQPPTPSSDLNIIPRPAKNTTNVSNCNMSRTKASEIISKLQINPINFILDARSIAYHWLLKTDLKSKSCHSEVAIVQRYVLAVFYHYTSGDSWFQNRGWLQGESECEWHGIRCDENRNIMGLSLGAFK